MLTLVIGGAASGKSEFAEKLAMEAGGGPRYYLATMRPFDAECRARIAKHRAMRAQKQFVTLEQYTNLASLRLPQRGVVLLECLSNLAANERYSPEGAGEGAQEAVVAGVKSLCVQSEAVVVVSNEVFSGGNEYAGDTAAYLQLLAALNRTLAARADAVWEVACGLAQYRGGGCRPWFC